MLIPVYATPYDEWNANKRNLSQINLSSFAVSPPPIKTRVVRRVVYDFAYTSVSETEGVFK